jgi:hypothetical protein
MNLEYKITLEFDRDRIQTYWESYLNKGSVIFIPTRHFPAFLGLSSIGLIIWGLFEQDVYNSSTLIGVGIGIFPLSILLFFVYRPQKIKINSLASMNERALQKQWNEYYAQKIKVNIIMTPKEFILKTDDSEKAYTWQAFKSLDEYSTGFIISFLDGYRKFIPRLVFVDEKQINKFKELIKEYKNNF